jgi:uncharacterized protein (DUF427 family)
MSNGHQITIDPTEQHVVVRIDGVTVAESDRAVVLEETGLPPRYYLPRDDVRFELLQPTSRASTCPYKGQASYWSVMIGDRVLENVVWAYEDPIPEAEGIRGLLSFYNERVELSVGDAVDVAR